MDLTQALYTTRAMRRVLPDPIPDQVVQAMLDAAVRSPSGGNSQNWRFVVVTDPETRAKVGALYEKAFRVLLDSVYGRALERARQKGDDGTLRVFSSAQWLADNAAGVPLWLFFYGRGDESGASIYPAVWSAMLAARGQGVGTCLTTILGSFREKETAQLLGVPARPGVEAGGGGFLWVPPRTMGSGCPPTRPSGDLRRPVGQPGCPGRVDEPLWEDGAT